MFVSLCEYVSMCVYSFVFLTIIFYDCWVDGFCQIGLYKLLRVCVGLRNFAVNQY